MPTRAVVIQNPAAGQDNWQEQVEAAVTTLREAGWEVTLRETTGQGDATEFAREAVADKVDVVVVAGGDGTVNEALQGLAEQRTTALAVLPGGTVNVWANPKKTGKGPGHYSRKTGIDLQMDQLEPKKPILLHELLHAFHDQQLPGGFSNADVEKFYERGKEAGWPRDSYLMSNSHEFFAVSASVYLYGDIPRPPESRKLLRAKQPQFYQWLADLYDDGKAR